MSNKKLKKDLLEQKQSDLNTYINQANSAISVVTTLINSLGAINEKIDTEIREIDEYTASLAITKTGLDDAKLKNERIIRNFESLLNTN